MSARSTSRVSTPSLVTSPPLPSGALSGSSSRRGTPSRFASMSNTSSLPLPTAMSRRASNLSSRMSNSGSSSAIGGAGGAGGAGGTGRKVSTVTQPKDGRVDERDWATMEPDEVFRRLPVNEVKRVESKMRSDALNKQTELRSMVGTRYRDLLTSASQITSLHSSSLRLSSGLQTVARACANPTELAAGDSTSDPQASDAEDVGTLLPVAAHMKLLLDAPEALYSYLSHQAYLDAAFLWLVTRVVREGLMSMPDEVKGPYVQLLQKQWETLLPFRGQIAHRATAALRKREQLDPKTLSDTLLAIILLESLPIPEALDILLSQRLKTIRDILANAPEPSSKKAEHNVGGRRRRRSSRVEVANAVRESVHQRESISNVIAEAVQSLLDTVNLVHAVFDSKRTILGGESLIAEAIRLVQEGEPISVTLQPPAPIHMLAHQRRRSRLSISLPLPPRVGTPSHNPPATTPRIIQALPSSQILLRYLPSSIIGFTPFIAPSTTPALADKLVPWQTSVVDLLGKSVPAWLAVLHSVTDVWAVRSAIKSLLGDAPFEFQIDASLEVEWGARVKAIWTAKLDALVTSSSAALRDAGEKIRSGDEDHDNDPESFMFSDIAFPSAPVSSLAAPTHSAAFTSFLSTLKKRAAFRTPLLDSVLSVLEAAATDLKADLHGLPVTLFDDYRAKLVGALDALVKGLNDVLDAVGPSRGDNKDGIEAELFVGRIALYLAHTSSFLDDLVGATQVDLESTKVALLDIHAASTNQWRGKTVTDAVKELAPLFEDSHETVNIQSIWHGPFPTQPSAPILVALTELVEAVRRLGIPPGITIPIVPDLISAFIEATRTLEGWKKQDGEMVAQAVVDLGFLTLLKGDDLSRDEAIQKLLAKLPASVPSEFASTLPAIVLEALRRTQLILFPLTSHLVPAIPAAPDSGTWSSYSLLSDSRNASLLRIGAPALANRAAGLSTEFRSPIAVARPGKRFGLLSIVA